MAYTLMEYSKQNRYNTNYVNRSLPKIISYMLLVESSTWKFHVDIFVAISLGKGKSILTFRLVVILPACVWYCITEYFLWLSYVISLIIAIVELHPLSNKIWTFLKFYSNITIIHTYM